MTKTPLNEKFAYDAEGRQVAFCTSDPDPAVCANAEGARRTLYRYDGEGRRVQRLSPAGATTTYVYDAMGNLAAEYSTESQPIAPYQGLQ